MKTLKPLWVTGSKRVSTWSPLATAFNTRPTSRPIFDTLREKTVSALVNFLLNNITVDYLYYNHSNK